MTEGLPVQPAKDPDEFELIDYEQLRNWGSFILHATGRHKPLVLLTFLGTMAVILTVLAVLPRTYHVEAQLLAQKNSLMPALGNPGRHVPSDADAPTRAASEAVKRRDNLVSLMKQTDLLNYWDRTRPPLLRVKDRLFDLLLGPRSEDERVTDMVGFLDSRFDVTTGESTVNIGIDWPDAQMAYQLVETAQQNFLEQRHSAEVSAIAEAITILEGHAANLREAIDDAREDLRRADDPSARNRRANTVPLPRRDPAKEALRAEAAETKVMLEAKRRAINELETFRSRRLAELQSELTQQQAVYADAHPAVVKLKQSIAAFEEDSPQLSALKNDEKDLLAEQAKISASMRLDPQPPGGARASEADPRTPSSGAGGDGLTADEARTRLRFAMEKYDVLLQRIDSARIELDTARAAFKYRYSVTRPPTFPKRAVKPKVPVVVAMGFVLALGAGVLASVFRDLRSGRVLEKWQIERVLELRVLGEVPRA